MASEAISKNCLDFCPNCGETGNYPEDENYSDGQFCATYTCENCGITYYEFYEYAGTTWYPENNQGNEK